jgi:hypothetical protein
MKSSVPPYLTGGTGRNGGAIRATLIFILREIVSGINCVDWRANSCLLVDARLSGGVFCK